MGRRIGGAARSGAAVERCRRRSRGPPTSTAPRQPTRAAIIVAPSRRSRSWPMAATTVAMVWLGFLYEQGQGTVQDYDEAMRRFRTAADLGNAQAEFCGRRHVRQRIWRPPRTPSKPSAGIACRPSMARPSPSMPWARPMKRGEGAPRDLPRRSPLVSRRPPITEQYRCPGGAAAADHQSRVTEARRRIRRRRPCNP